MKKAISFILVFMLLFTTSTNFIEAAALDPGGRHADIYIKGHTLDTYKPKKGYYSPRIINGTSFVPLRAIAEAYQWDINYISKSKEIIIKDKDNNTISLKVGSKKAKKNNKNINLNVSPYIYNGHTYVPVRFVSESLGIKVYWDATSKSILIGESDKANLNHPTINIMDDKFTISIDPKYYDQIIFNKEKNLDTYYLQEKTNYEYLSEKYKLIDEDIPQVAIVSYIINSNKIYKDITFPIFIVKNDNLEDYLIFYPPTDVQFDYSNTRLTNNYNNIYNNFDKVITGVTINY